MKIELPKPAGDAELQAAALGRLLFRIVATSIEAGYQPGAVCTALIRNTANLIDQFEPATQAQALDVLEQAMAKIRKGERPWTH